MQHVHVGHHHGSSSHCVWFEKLVAGLRVTSVSCLPSVVQHQSTRPLTELPHRQLQRPEFILQHRPLSLSPNIPSTKGSKASPAAYRHGFHQRRVPVRPQWYRTIFASMGHLPRDRSYLICIDFYLQKQNHSFISSIGIIALALASREPVIAQRRGRSKRPFYHHLYLLESSSP